MAALTVCSNHLQQTGMFVGSQRDLQYSESAWWHCYNDDVISCSWIQL